MAFGLVEWVRGGEKFWKRRKKIKERRWGSQPIVPVIVSKYAVGPVMIGDHPRRSDSERTYCHVVANIDFNRRQLRTTG